MALTVAQLVTALQALTQGNRILLQFNLRTAGAETGVVNSVVATDAAGQAISTVVLSCAGPGPRDI